MKMLLTGPQAITIFPVAKDEAVPQSAKSSSFATPQGYIVAETGNLYLYVKGQEYKFVDKDMHDAALAGATPGSASSAHDGEYATCAEFKELEAKVASIHDKVECLDAVLYTPLKQAFTGVALTEGEHNGKN